MTAGYLVWNVPSGPVFDGDRECCDDCGCRMGGGETGYQHPGDKLCCAECHDARVLVQRAVEAREAEIVAEHDAWREQHAGCTGCYECEPEAAEGLQ